MYQGKDILLHHTAGFRISFAQFFIGLFLFLFDDLLQFCVFHCSIGFDFFIFDIFLMVRGRVPIEFLLQKMRFKTKFKRSTFWSDEKEGSSSTIRC